VDGNSNFFADEVLVHNCLIIDDPIKDLEQARSAAYRDRAWRFWQAVAVPRLGPGAKCVLIQTRWAENDLAGMLLEHDGDRRRGGRWEVVSIPAIAEDEQDDPLGRKPGEGMVSARGDRDWQAIRASVGEYVFASLYQQRPAPAEGGLFKRLWWRWWTPAPSIGPGSDRIDLAGRIYELRDSWKFITGDLAASTRTSADWTVAAAWALTVSGDLVLLDYQRGRVGEQDHFDLFRPLAQRWSVDTVFLEASQWGTTLVAEASRSGLHITPLQAETDKFSRALPYSARASGGRVWLPAGAREKMSAWVDEHASFPSARHDDMVDVGSMATRVAVTKWQPPPPTPYRASTPDRDLDFLGSTYEVNLLEVPL
jgi:predicted phage terminase large subunit-like protein